MIRHPPLPRRCTRPRRLRALHAHNLPLGIVPVPAGPRPPARVVDRGDGQSSAGRPDRRVERAMSSARPRAPTSARRRHARLSPTARCRHSRARRRFRRQDRVGQAARSAKSSAWRSRSARFSSRVMPSAGGQSWPPKPGVARMWPMLALHAAWSRRCARARARRGGRRARPARPGGEALGDEGQRQPRSPTASSVRAGSAERGARQPSRISSTAPSALSPRRGTVVAPVVGSAPRKS